MKFYEITYVRRYEKKVRVSAEDVKEAEAMGKTLMSHTDLIDFNPEDFGSTDISVAEVIFDDYEDEE